MRKIAPEQNTFFDRKLDWGTPEGVSFRKSVQQPRFSAVFAEFPQGKEVKVLQIKISALAALAIVPILAGAQNKTYTVQQGDTISGIAQQFHLRRADLVAANSLPNSHKLRVGMSLRIPARAPGQGSAKETTHITAAAKSGHTVRNGESDWTIAHRHGITVAQLKAMNPNVSFSPLKVGTTVNVPGAKTIAKVTPSQPAATNSKPATKVAAKTYKIQSGDNDWSLARKLDTRVAVLKDLNPGVNLSKLRPGQTIRIPGTVTVAAKGEPTVQVRTASSSISTKYAETAKDGCIIRRKPSTNAEKVTVVEKGTDVVVLDRQGDWYKLRFPKGTVGWMRGDLLRPMKASQYIAKRPASEPTRTAARKPKSEPTRVASSSKPKSKATTKKPSTRVASRPSRPSSATRVASRPSRPTGSGSLASASGVIATAKQQLGIRYRWGGTSRGGFDCSGFVQYSYKKNGVSLPRTSSDMSRVGSSVSKSNLKPGDLICFQTRRSSRVSHVGMYVGDGKFIHASSGKGRVMVSNLSDSYYSKRIVTMRRVSDKVASQSSSSKKKVEAPKVD